MSRVEEIASGKWELQVLEKCAQAVSKEVGFALTESCLRKLLKPARMFDDDFDIDKSVWKSLELQEGAG